VSSGAPLPVPPRMRLPQLHMHRPDLDDLPPLEVPDGYELRTYRPGDEAIWGTIMDVCLPMVRSQWRPEIVREKLTSLPQFDPEGLFFATWRGIPVGTATAWLGRPEEQEIGCVHMVGVLPDHRGRRLGYVVSLATLHRFRERGLRAAMLDTDDFRLSAIRAYLDLGFQPEQRHPSHPERWAVVLAALHEGSAIEYPSAAPALAGPIGLVHNDVKAPIHEGWSEIVSEVELFPAFEEALEGIDGFSHLQILFWIHKVTVEQRLIRRLHPRDRAELPLMGVLATRSQYRPNPIGLTVVRYLGRQGRRLRVQGLDAIDGTPILDIKPLARREVTEDEVRAPEWTLT
jgi:mycothiol synthase